MFSAGFLGNLSYNKTILFDSFPIIKCTPSSGHIEESVGSTSSSINVTKIDQEHCNPSIQSKSKATGDENASQQRRFYSGILRPRNIVVPECVGRW
ncbi:hypothetical protein P879_10556 [Paragonimus westermani]|uniref:Uncharacterized protein n=1 Tax=Paragonimus westermani TaxID=34504 RepID=A0A8T0D503_9TREM|nr:hypothetical protein P879_10556 [Paragonimus westermani]